MAVPPPPIVNFHPIHAGECPQTPEGVVNPVHLSTECGACGQSASLRVIASRIRVADGAVINWCVCPCPRAEPNVVLLRSNEVIAQHPDAREYVSGPRWPADLGRLYDEAGRAYAAGAYTAAAMTARKLLMVCACQEGDTDGKSFQSYVDFITTQVLAFPKARGSIDRIRKIGNDANHRIDFVSREDAKRAMEIITYVLNTVYALPDPD